VGDAIKTRWPLAVAHARAQELAVLFRPGCLRIQIAGSIRRRKPDVGDIELLVIPRTEKRVADLFGNEAEVDLLDDLIQGYIRAGILDYRLTVKGGKTYGAKNKLLVDVESGIPLDVFSTDYANWGMALTVRTGSADFNVRLMARFRALGMAGHAYAGYTGRDGKEYTCPSEESVFEAVGWNWLKPEERI